MPSSSSSPPAPPPSARQQRSSRLTFQDRSLSPVAGGGRYASPSPGPTWRSSSAHSGRATSRSRLLWHPNRGSSASDAQSVQNGNSNSNGKASSSSVSPPPRRGDERWKVSTDVRTRLPGPLRRFSGWRDPNLKPPYEPLPFPPFSWLKHLSLQHETWLLSTIGSFVGIALIEIVNVAGFPDEGIILIVASFGASAVLCFATIESPLAQPRHLVGGQVLSAILAVALTRLFRLASGYQLDDTTHLGDLGHLVWLNGALAMALSLLLMQATGTVHPPGGATALIASVQPAAVAMSWRLIYVVLISSLVMLGWAMIINNVGRRRWPSYWFSGTKVYVRAPTGEPEVKTTDAVAMEMEEGLSPHGFANAMDLIPEDELVEEDAHAYTRDDAEQPDRGRTTEPAFRRGRMREYVQTGP